MYLEFDKSITIKKKLNEIYSIISDVNQWNNWSPWYCLEPKSKITISEDEKSGYTTLEWDGDLIGSGRMTVINKTPTSIYYDLFFLRPFKSQSKVWFHLKEKNNETEVTWGMKSKLPFFMYFFKNMMKSYIAADYVRGLNRLKEYAETGTLLCQMSDVEFVSQNKFYLLGKRNQTSVELLGPVMNSLFEEIMKDIESKKIPVPDGFISYYHHFDLVKSKTDFTCGVLYNRDVEIDNNYIKTEINDHSNIKLTLKGTYNHLPTAWSKLWCYQKGKKLKLNKNISFYELYLNSPKMVEPKDILTEIRIPIKNSLIK